MTAPVSHKTGIAALIEANNKPTPPSESSSNLFGEDGFTFGDIIDIINPLQHIPIINNIYRNVTGDTIAPAMQVAGGALFGGPIGAVTSLVMTVFQSQNETESIDPDSPYQDRQTASVNPATIANNTASSFPTTINNSDYSITNKLEKTDTTKSIRNNNLGWTLNSDFINRAFSTSSKINHPISMNSSHKNRVYQPADGIVNLAYKNIEIDTNPISSTNSPAHSIDITIGKTLSSS